MSLLEVNKITPQSGTTLTLGDTGDTINFGSGVLPNFENLTVTGDLTVDTNSLKVDSTNNYVGIGTASPSVALDVVGAITATGTVTTTSSSGSSTLVINGADLFDSSIFLNDAGSNSYSIFKDGSQSDDFRLLSYGDTAGNTDILRYSKNGSLRFQTAATERMRIDSSGNVLIGKTSDAFADVGVVLSDSQANSFTRDGANVISVRRNTSDGDIVSFYKDTTKVGSIGVNASDNIYLSGNSTHAGIQFGSTSAIAFQNGSIVNNTIDLGASTHTWKDGYFGGTVNSADLDVTVGSAGNGLQMTAAGDHYINLGADSNRSGASQSLLQMEGKWNGTAVARMQFVSGTDTTNKDDAEIRFQTASAGTPSTAMTIDSSGILKIGTSGTATPYVHSKFAIDTGLYSYMDLISTGSSGINFGDAAASQIGSIEYSHSANYLRFITNGSERMRIDVSGNVGIGTTTLPRTLNINNSSGNGSIGIDGTATSNPQIAFKQGGTDKGYVTYWDSSDTLALTDGSANGLHFKPSTGRVGIGTSSPERTLHLESAAPEIMMKDSDNATYVTMLSNDGVLSFGRNGSESMRLTSSGELLYGKTTTDVGTAGIRFISGGRIFVTRDNDPTAYFRRNTSVGNIMEFNQAGTSVGYIGSYTGSGVSQFFVSGADTGFKFNSTVNVIAPSNATGGDRNNQIDFGASANAWKNGYFGGTVTANAFSGDGSALTNLPSSGETAFAYVNFNGKNTPSIRDDFNVSSITDNQTGDYSVNFSSNASSANYTAAGHGGDPNEDGEPFWTQAISTSAFRGWLKVPNSGRNDRTYVMCTIHGG